ncbi:hypothetical protein [Pontibacter pudoricolor]|nr:hypothetical protein [Pontibacter pudoricolor]
MSVWFGLGLKLLLIRCVNGIYNMLDFLQNLKGFLLFSGTME